MFGFRPAVILIRHPAKVAFSHFRKFKRKNPDLDYSIEDYLDNAFADFFVDYANKVYKHVGQKNRVFVSYTDLLAEQELENQPSWESIIQFIFGDVKQDLLKKAVDNNSAQKKSSSNAKKYIRRTPPNKLNEFYDEELAIIEHLRPKLEAELRPSIAEYFKKKSFFKLLKAIHISL